MMPKNPKQKYKLLYVMRLLYEETDERNGLTVADMISALGDMGIEAERKGIYSDIETLSDYGMDIEKRKGAGGAVTYHLVSREFELAELKLLVDAVQASKFITRKKSEELIGKLEALAGKKQAQQLKRQVFVSNRIKTMNESIYYSVDYIHGAMIDDKKISFKYFDWNQNKEKILRHGGRVYTVSPWALMWDDENYYLIAYDSLSGSKKHYRVDRMMDMQVLSEAREGGEELAGVDTALYSKQTFGMYGGREETVRLRCHNSLANVMVDRFGKETTFFNADSGHFDIVVKVTVSPVFLSWVATFGSDIRIMSPDAVIEEYLALLRRAAKQYE